MAKKNKQVLSDINYSIDTVKKIKDGYKFTKEEKQEILHKFVGTSPDNNSYFTKFEVCNFIKQLLNIKSGKIADLSGGLGNMAMPFVREYGKLDGDITFDLFEFDENNSLAAEMAWSDFENVNVNGSFNSIERHEEIPEYDIILGNPPFSGSLEYWSEWNHAKNGKAKNNNIADAFVDLSIRKVKDKGYVALVLPYGHLYKGNATAKLRAWMKDKVALKAVIPLNEKTFENAGIKGTKVGTVLCIWEKGVPQKEVFYGDLYDTDDLETEMRSMAHQFQLILKGNYDLVYQSDSSSGLHAKLNEKLQPWTG